MKCLLCLKNLTWIVRILFYFIFNNGLIDVLLNLGDVDEALYVLDKMLEPNAKFPPNDVTGDVVLN